MPIDSQTKAYLSLNALPAPALPVTEMTASSNPHDEAACATPAPSTSKEGSNECRNRIVVVVLSVAEFRGAASRVLFLSDTYPSGSRLYVFPAPVVGH